MRVPGTFSVVLACTLASTCGGGDLPGLNELIAEALERNPEIQAARKRLEALRQRPRQEGSLPDPIFSFGYNSNGSPRPFASIGREPTSNAGFSVAQEFPYPGKRTLRGHIALKEADAEFQTYQAVQLSIVSRVKQAYHKPHHAYVAAEILERNKDLFERLLQEARLDQIRRARDRARRR